MPLTFYSISISRPLSVSCLAFFSIFGTTLGISVRASGPIDASSDRDSLKWVIIYHWLHFVAEVLCCWQLWQLCDSGQLQFALLSCFLFFFFFFFFSPQMQFGQTISISSSFDPHYQDRHRFVLSSLSSPVFVSLFFRHSTRPQSQSPSQSQLVQLLGNFVYKSN